MGEIGWNGIAGFGPTLTYHLHPRVSFDLGGGFSLTGWKAGLRSRYNLLNGPVTPFIGVGAMSTSGLGQLAFDDPQAEGGNTPPQEAVTIRVLPSAFFQGVVGIDWTSPHGFTLVSALGYAWLLNGDNVEVVAGTPTDEHKQAFDALFRSGLVITLATGYSFE